MLLTEKKMYTLKVHKQVKHTYNQLVHWYRFAETSNFSASCNSPDSCIGGFSKLYDIIQRFLKEKPNYLLLNGDDYFQGMLYYTLGERKITQGFMNKLSFDATVLQNTEFDNDIEEVFPFITALTSPVVTANINDAEEQEI